MPNTIPAYTIGGITRPELILDSAGNIILTPEAAAFQAAYGTKALYFGCPVNTPFPPVAPTLSAPVDSNGGINSVLENAAVGSQVGLTVQATNPGGLPVTYSLTDSAGGRFQINATTGVVTVAAGAPLDYETSPGHAYNITVRATDGILATSQTFTIGVGNVNEAPAGTDGAVAASEDTNYVFSAADFGFTDPSDSSAPNALAAVRITTLPAAGMLRNNGIAVNAGDFVSAADIAAGHLVFVAAANANGAGYASFTFQVRDTGGTANGGVDLDQSPNTITINVGAVNDAPTATNLTQSLTINEDAAATTLFTVAPAVGDIDSATVTTRLTLNAAAGVLVGAGPGVLSAGVLTYTITGTPAVVSTALAAVTYDSADNFNGTTSVGVTIDDGASGPQGINPTGTVSITVNAVNDAPNATNLTQSLVIDEDAAPTALFTTTPLVTDDSATVTATLTVANPAAGTLSGGGFTATANPGEYTFSGTPAQVTAALALVQFDSSDDFNGSTTVAVAISDGLAGPQNLPDPTGTISITINAVNDAPTATNLTQSLVIGEDGAATTLFTLAPVVSDIDSATVTATLTLDAAAGVLTGAGAGVLNAGVLTYTITGTPAAVTIALAGVAFDSAPDFNGITDVGITIDDGANGPQGSNPIGAGHVTINAVNDAPTATNLTQSLVINEDGAAATLFTLAPVVADIDSSTVTATLTLDAAAGVLTGAGAGVLAAGVLTYTITGTPAAVNAVLAAVTYDSADNFNGATSVGVTIDDGANGPQGTNPTGTISITVNAVNDAPTATGMTQSLTIDEDAAATTLFTVPPVTADIDSASVTATLTLDAAAGVLVGAGAGVLAAGVLTYTVTGTPAAVNAALAAVTYDSAPDFFGTTSVGVTIDDGANGPQGANPAGTVSITVNSVNDAPTVTAAANNPSYVPGADLFSGVTASTVETGQSIDQVVLTVSNVLGNDESLSIDGDTVALLDGTVSGAPTATLGVSYSVAVSGNTATITITSPGLTGAQTASLIDGLSYTNVTVDPGELPRVVTIVSLHDTGGTANGGVDTGTPGIASTVNFNVPPTVTAGHTLNYTENQAATAFDPAIAVSDPDNASLVSATVQITANYVNGEDVLGFTNQNGITGSFNAATGTLTLTGSSSVANYQVALASVTYVNTSENPSGAARTVTIITNDGAADSPSVTDTINVTPVNDAPVVTAGHTLNYTENQAATAIDTAILVSDVDNANLASATVQITGNYANGQDILGFTNQNGITGSFNAANGTLTLSGSSSVANYQTALASVTYVNTSENPSGLARTVTIITNDGAASSVAATETINLTPVNDAPVTTAGGTLNYTENQVATAIDTGIALADVDNASLTSATVQITGNYANGQDILGFTNQNGISGSFNAANGTLTLTGSSSVANYQTALRSVTYFDSSENPSGLDRTVTYTVSDGALNSNASTSTIHVTPVNDAPVVTFSAINGFIEPPNGTPAANSVPVTIAPNLAISDADGGNLTGVSFVLNNLKPSDALSVSGHAGSSGTIGGISFTISSTASTETITFSGIDTIANYNAALHLVQFNNTSENPDTTARSYTVSATDDGGTANGGVDTGSATTTETVTAVDDAPINTIPADAAVPTAFSNTDTAISGLSVADVDAGSGLVTTQLSVTNGTVAVTLAGGATISAGASGTATLTLSGTVAAINATLANNVTFHSTDGFTGQANLTVLTNDQSNTGTGGPQTDTDVVHIGVVPQVWYIDNTNAGPGNGAGTATDPFHSIAAFNASPGPGQNDYIVIQTGTGTYTGDGLNLQNGQQVYGAGETLSFTNPVNGTVVNVLNGSGTRPTINVTTAGDQGIDLASDNTIRGINITTAAGTTGLDDGQGAGGNAVGNLTVSNMSISGAGQAVDIDQGGNLNVVLDSVSSTGGAQGIQLAGTASSGAGLLSGTFNGGTGSISGSTGAGFLVGNGSGGAFTGGTLTISYGGTITTGANVNVVNIQDHSSGLVTLSGNLTKTGASGSAIVLDENSSSFTFSGSASSFVTGTSNAINITNQSAGTIAFQGSLDIDTSLGTGVNLAGNNTGATINFTGGNLTIDSSNSGGGFIATGGGTVNVTGSGNHIASATGTALNISNTTIGASNVTFHDISAGTVGVGPNNGIVLNNTGTSGHLVVTGTGTTAGSGGTIQNTTGDAISLTNTQDVTLNNMNISGSKGNGIAGSFVNGIVLNGLNISGSGDSTAGNGEGNIYLFELTGNASHVTTFNNLSVTNSYVHNVFIENTGGTLADLVVTNSTFSNNGASTVAGSEFVINLATGGVAGTPTATVHATHNTFSGNLTTPSTYTATGFQGSSNDGTLNVHLGDGSAGGLNTFDTNNSGITLSSALAGNLNFDVNNNLVTHNRAVGIAVNHFGTGTVTGFLRNTTIGTQGQAGSGAQIGNGLDIHDEAASGSMTLSVTNNIIQSVGGSGLGFEGINAQIGVGSQNSASTLNLTLTGNTIRDIIDDRGLFVNNFNTAGASVINANISGNTFSNANASGANTTARVGGAPGGSDHVNVTQASAAALAAANGLTASAAPGNNMRIDTNVFFNQAAPPAPPATPQMALNGQGPGSSEVLTMDALAPLLAVAIAHWAAAGASAAQIAQMEYAAAHIRIDDLPNSGFLANSDAHGIITIDGNAAGWGWFIDSTPADNAEFHTTTVPNQLMANGGSAASHIDLLTVIEHELGHVIGLPDSTSAGVMNVALDAGERRLPDPVDVALANPGQAQAQAPLLPVIRGTAGNDTIDAGHGGVILVGGAGADNFVFANVDVRGSTPPPLTHVADYKFAEGDSFDFSALTAKFHYSDIADASLVRVVEDPSGSFATLQFNTNAKSDFGPHWTNVAQLDGAHAGDDVGVLIDSHSAVHLAHLHVGLLA